ncbi:MAG: class I SAM-dependent methyltransferase [Acutalibacteraceae bacterium]
MCLAFNANEYDGKIRQTMPYYDIMYTQILDLVRTVVPYPKAWLDIGCGSGKIGLTCAEQYKENCPSFVMCDVSEEMLDIAKRNLTGKMRAEFWNCAAQDIDEHERFDVVTAIFVNHYLNREERLKSLKNSLNALKKGGIFITFENTAPLTQQGKAVALERWKSYQLAMGKENTEVQKHIARYGVSYFPITISEQIALLRESGFEYAEPFWFSYLQAGFYAVK